MMKGNTKPFVLSATSFNPSIRLVFGETLRANGVAYRSMNGFVNPLFTSTIEFDFFPFI